MRFGEISELVGEHPAEDREIRDNPLVERKTVRSLQKSPEQEPCLLSYEVLK